MQPTVIVGYDGTAPGQAAVAEAAREAALRGAQLTVLTASHRLPFDESPELPQAEPKKPFARRPRTSRCKAPSTPRTSSRACR